MHDWRSVEGEKGKMYIFSPFQISSGKNLSLSLSLSLSES